MNIKKPNNCLNCKAKAELVRFGGGLYQCRCTGCGSLGRLTPYKSDAIKYWNEEHRPEPETLPESLAFVSISADEYKEYQRLKEAAKPLTVDEMREYCIKWCEGLGLIPSTEMVPIGTLGLAIRHNKDQEGPYWAIYFKGYRISAIGSEYFATNHCIIAVYTIIRAIERGELGGQNG